MLLLKDWGCSFSYDNKGKFLNLDECKRILKDKYKEMGWIFISRKNS